MRLFNFTGSRHVQRVRLNCIAIYFLALADDLQDNNHRNFVWTLPF
jgi:hypothetical protein